MNFVRPLIGDALELGGYATTIKQVWHGDALYVQMRVCNYGFMDIRCSIQL
ncbi:MAG: hypothetical protein ACYTXT_17230 [Nostoc sp.]